MNKKISEVKEKIKNSEIKKKNYNVETGEMEVVSAKKATDTFMYKVAIQFKNRNNK